MTDLSVYDNDSTLYLFSSLTAGSSHIVTATSRIETILKANKIPFKGVDTATDEVARKLYGRRASGKKLPLLFKEGFLVGDLEQIEEWNEYGELKEALGVVAAPPPAKPTSTQAAAAPKPASKENASPTAAATSEQNLAIRQLGAEAAAVAASKKPAPANIQTTNPKLAEKVNSPALSTPTKGKAELSGILSPRNVPLPDTPKVGTTPSIPKVVDQQKGVKQPPKEHVDAANPALNAGPTKVSQASPASPTTAKSPPPLSPRTSSSGSRTFHGSPIEELSKEDAKKLEDEQAIPEVSSSEEADEESEEDEAETSEAVEKLNIQPTAGAADASKPPTQVKGSAESKSEDESASKVAVSKPPGVKADESDEEDDSDDDDDDDDKDDNDDDEDEDKDEDEDEEEESSDDTDAKPQTQSAKAAEKAGESVND